MWCVVKNYIDFLFVVEKSMHCQDVCVFEVAVDFDLSSQLKYNIAINDLLFGDDLYCNDGFSFSLSCQINMPISKGLKNKLLSFTEVPSNLEVLDTPVTWMEYFSLRLSEEVFWSPVKNVFIECTFVYFADFHELALWIFPFVFVFGFETLWLLI